MRLWRALADLARAFGDSESWCLIGGLMVQVYAFEHGVAPRPTRDIDLLGDARSRPSATEQLAGVVTELGGDRETPPATDPKLGYRFKMGGLLVEILGPEGLKTPAKTLGGLETIEVRGGTQALRRAQTVSISVAGAEPMPIRVPSLLGAILLKARALRVARRRFDQHRYDLILLLSLVESPRGLAAEEQLSARERRWLAEVQGDLGLPDPALGDRFSTAQLERAQQVFDLLVRG
ncbi:MAG: nucleotidyl transferase AbiEii/AbiGii toxin family protein [Solirubrobacterales bacterium]